MNYQDPELQSRLAPRYVSGQMRGAARRRFEKLMAMDAGLRREVREWEDHIYPLAQALPPVTPPKRVWRQISARVSQRESNRWGWNGVYLWRFVSGALAVALMAGVALYPLQVENAARAQLVAVLQNPAGAMLVIHADKTSVLRIRTLQNLDGVAGDRALELWAIAPGSAPKSLGLISTTGATVLTRPPGLNSTDLLAITLEPPGGSPSGQPTSAPIMSGSLLEI